MIVSIRRAGEMNVGHQVKPALLERFGKLCKCIGVDSHDGYLIRFIAYIVVDPPPIREIHFFYSGYRSKE